MSGNTATIVYTTQHAKTAFIMVNRILYVEASDVPGVSVIHLDNGDLIVAHTDERLLRERVELAAHMALMAKAAS